MPVLLIFHIFAVLLVWGREACQVLGREGTMNEVEDTRMSRARFHNLALLAFAILSATILTADEPPALNPFGSRDSEQRDDAVPGCIELSDGSVHPGSSI